jgi:hypothetical protein
LPKAKFPPSLHVMHCPFEGLKLSQFSPTSTHCPCGFKYCLDAHWVNSMQAPSIRR